MSEQDDMTPAPFSSMEEAKEQVLLLKDTNELFLSGIKQIMQKSHAETLSASAVSTAKLYSMQSTGYQEGFFAIQGHGDGGGAQGDGSGASSSGGSTEDKPDQGSCTQAVDVTEGTELGDGYLLNIQFAELIQRGPKNKAEYRLLEEVKAFLQPHEIEGALRGKLNLFQVRDMVTNGMVKAQLNQVLKSQETLDMEYLLQSDQICSIIHGLKDVEQSTTLEIAPEALQHIAPPQPSQDIGLHI